VFPHVLKRNPTQNPRQAHYHINDLSLYFTFLYFKEGVLRETWLDTVSIVRLTEGVLE